MDGEYSRTKESLIQFDSNYFLEQQGSLFPYEPKSLDEIVWPSASKVGMPELELKAQSMELVDPFMIWGEQSRKVVMTGTYAFYTDDYKFTALWSNPNMLVKSCCTVAIEPNFSVRPRMPFFVAGYEIFRKRWLARYWQSQGIKIIVDMNVAPCYLLLNLLGVPKGWTFYATRAHKGEYDILDKVFDLCCHHADTDDIQFLVYGGSDTTTAARCQRNGWLWQPEKMHRQRRRKHYEKMLVQRKLLGLS